MNTSTLIRDKELAGEIKHGKCLTCGTYVILAECKSGLDNFAKRLFCGREWCPTCGQLRSATHNRRIGRILSKICQIKQMGYFVIEFPKILRQVGRSGPDPDEVKGDGWCYSKEDLRRTTNEIIEIMAGHRTSRSRRTGGYFERGMLRWHWFGDMNEGQYNPHVNILVDGAFIKRKKLNEIKRALRSKLNVPGLIVNYSYVETPGQMFNKIEYITRSTFLKYEWDPYMAGELFNFRNQRFWGKWDRPAEWGLDQLNGEKTNGFIEIEKLRLGICAVCGQELKDIYLAGSDGHPVKWTRPIDAGYVTMWQGIEYGQTGYYRLAGLDSVMKEKLLYHRSDRTGTEENDGRKRQIAVTGGGGGGGGSGGSV